MACVVAAYSCTSGDGQPADLPSSWSCEMCTYTCASKRALTCHYTTAHAKKSAISQFVNSEWCSICGLVFDNFANVMTHVNSSTICNTQRVATARCKPLLRIASYNYSAATTTSCYGVVLCTTPRYCVSASQSRVLRGTTTHCPARLVALSSCDIHCCVAI